MKTRFITVLVHILNGKGNIYLINLTNGIFETQLMTRCHHQLGKPNIYEALYVLVNCQIIN